VEIPQAYRISALGDCVVAEPEAWHRIWIQTAQPTEINPGRIEEGEYAVIDGELHVKARGCLISKLRLHPGDDAALIPAAARVQTWARLLQTNRVSELGIV
jgi:hypothetical protein